MRERRPSECIEYYSGLAPDGNVRQVSMNTYMEASKCIDHWPSLDIDLADLRS